MSIAKKLMSIVMVLALAVGVTACGGSAKSAGGSAEVYSYAEDFVDPAYQGDCINTNAYSLILSGDNYTLQQAF